MIVTTTENIPGKKYEIVGFVSANRIMSIFTKTEIRKVSLKLIDEAKELGADAIVCIRVFSTSNNSTAMYGTVVKFV